ncbi:MAG: hypothetical protein IPL12_22870 [Bacteroidetes bacterium]|nr:hypothetical protein [Bacteroidota bacterium]
MTKHTLLLIIVFPFRYGLRTGSKGFEKHQVGQQVFHSIVRQHLNLTFPIQKTASGCLLSTDMEVDSFISLLIVVEFSGHMGDDYNANEELLITYLDFLQKLLCDYR